MLQMDLGYVEGVTHDSERHGTTTLFVALNIATGQIISECKQRHHHQEHLSFLKRVDENAPRRLNVHLVIDNYSTHKHPKIKRWLLAHPRWQVHYTLTYSSWRNLAKIWFSLISQKAIRQSFKSVKDFITKIDQFVLQYNTRSHPFNWTATADSNLQKSRDLVNKLLRHNTRVSKIP